MRTKTPLFVFGCLLLVASLAGCGADESAADPTGGFVPYVGGSADSSGPVALVHCQIVSEGEGFFATSTLSCSTGEALPGQPPIVMVGGSGGYIGDLNLRDGEVSLRFYADAYPITISVSSYVEDLLGLDRGQVLTETVQVDSAEALAERQSILLPFEVWTLTIESRTNVGRVTFDPFELTLQGGSMERYGERLERATVEGSINLRAGESRTVRVPVNAGQTSLSGVATFEGGEAAFELTAGGGYVLNAEGLVASGDVTGPTGQGAELARCEPGFIEGGLGFTCHVVPRPGVTLSAATVTMDGGEAQALPLDGSELALPATAGTEPVTLALSVQVEEGIDGLSWQTLPALEVTEVIERGSPQAVVAALPFELFHASFQLTGGVLMADFQTEGAHIVRFTESWNGAFEATTSPLTLYISQEDPDVWLAVNAEQPAISGTFSIYNQAGARATVQLDLEATDYIVNPEGLGPIEPPAAGTELVRCWINAEGGLRCERNAEASILSATLDALLLPFDQTLDFTIDPGLNNLVTFTSDFLPAVLTLSVSIPGQEELLTVERRIEALGDLPESAPLLIAVPAS